MRMAVLILLVQVACGGGDTPAGGADAGPTTPPRGCDVAAPTGPVFHVAVAGDDAAGDGSEGAPWATIGHAIRQVPDGSTILVGAGTYSGRIRLDESFAAGVVIRSAEPYRARLRNNGPVVTIYTGQGITLEGFDIAHDGPGASALVVQIQDLRGEAGGDDRTGRIVLRGNVLHDSYANDILKINNGAGDVLVERNVFYNQTGSDEHIDVNSVTGVVIQDNVFFNDFAGSGRAIGNDTSSFIVIKDSNGTDDLVLGARDVAVRRNVFLSWQGNDRSPFVQVGEDTVSYFEADGVVVENNLMLGDSTVKMGAAFAVFGSRDVTFRNNTVVGDLPSRAFAVRLFQLGDNRPSEGVRLVNNVWADPTGTMGLFSEGNDGGPATVGLDSNLYWNGGAATPGGEVIDPGDDARAVVGDPLLAGGAPIVVPRWDPDTGRFADGSATTCAVHAALVARAVPGAGSPAIDAADPALAPSDDILGRARGASPELGAVEVF
jgi:hypothetical protein